MFEPVGDKMFIDKWEDVGSHIIRPENQDMNQSHTFVIKAIGEGILINDGTIYRPDLRPSDKVCIVGRIQTVKVKEGEFHVANMSDVIAVDRSDRIPDKI